MQKNPARLFYNPHFSLPSPDCRITCSRDPVWSPISSHAQHPIVNCRVVHLLGIGDTLPFEVLTVEPNVIGILQTVVVDVKFSYLRGNCGGR